MDWLDFSRTRDDKLQIDASIQLCLDTYAGAWRYPSHVWSPHSFLFFLPTAFSAPQGYQVVPCGAWASGGPQPRYSRTRLATSRSIWGWMQLHCHSNYIPWLLLHCFHISRLILKQKCTQCEHKTLPSIWRKVWDQIWIHASALIQFSKCMI